MHADNSAHLIAAARRRHEESRQRAVHAIRTAKTAGQRPTISALAQTARVSRSFLYGNPDLLEALHELRPPASSDHQTAPPAQQASHKSLLGRLASLTEKNKALRAENTDLRRRLEAAHGELRERPPHP